MRIAVLHDCEHWAQGRHSAGLKKYAPSGIEVERFDIDRFKSDESWDAVYCIYLASASPRMGKRVVACVASHAWQHAAKNPTDWRTRGVTKIRNDRSGARFVSRLDGVICRSEELRTWAAKYNSVARRIPAGVDTEIFNPGGRKKQNGKLRVGWCGQINPERGNHFKGYYEVWQPLKSRVGDKYDMVENRSTAKTARSVVEMALWYKTLDVFCCTAAAEGTPNPPLEAAASGCAILTTNVGQMRDWMALRNMELVLPDYGNEIQANRVVDKFVDSLAILEDSCIRDFAVEILLASIEKWYDYRVIAPMTLEYVAGT